MTVSSAHLKTSALQFNENNPLMYILNKVVLEPTPEELNNQEMSHHSAHELLLLIASLLR